MTAKKRKTEELRSYAPLGALYRSPRGQEYFAWWIISPGGPPGTPSGEIPMSDYVVWSRRTRRMVPLRQMRLKMLSECAQYTAEKLSAELISEETAMHVLDYIYAEIGRQLNKAEERKTKKERK